MMFEYIWCSTVVHHCISKWCNSINKTELGRPTMQRSVTAISMSSFFLVMAKSWLVNLPDSRSANLNLKHGPSNPKHGKPLWREPWSSPVHWQNSILWVALLLFAETFVEVFAASSSSIQFFKCFANSSENLESANSTVRDCKYLSFSCITSCASVLWLSSILQNEQPLTASANFCNRGADWALLNASEETSAHVESI